MTLSTEELLQGAFTYGIPVLSEPDGVPAVAPSGAAALGAVSTDKIMDNAIKRYLGRMPAGVKPDAIRAQLARRFVAIGSGDHIVYMPSRGRGAGAGGGSFYGGGGGSAYGAPGSARAAGSGYAWSRGGGYGASPPDGTGPPGSAWASMPTSPDALTGAANVLATYASQTISAARRTLYDFQPLLAAADLEATEGTRTVVAADLDTLLADLSQEDLVPGAVDFDFGQLGFATLTRTEADPDTIGGHLGVLRERFNLSKDNVRVLHDEQQVFAFRIMVQSLDALLDVWLDAKGGFLLDENSPQIFLSAQFELLDRWRGIALYRLQRVETTLEQLGLPAESVELELDDGSRVFLNQLLDWAREALNQGVPEPEDLDQLGVDEVAQWGARIDQLASLFSQVQPPTLVGSTRVAGAATGIAPPGDIRWLRFQAMFKDFADSLQEVADIAKATGCRPPHELSGFTSQVTASGNVAVFVFGSRFEPGAELSLRNSSGKGGSASALTGTAFVSETLLIAEFLADDIEAYDSLVATDANGCSQELSLDASFKQGAARARASRARRGGSRSRRRSGGTSSSQRGRARGEPPEQGQP